MKTQRRKYAVKHVTINPCITIQLGPVINPWQRGRHFLDIFNGSYTINILFENVTCLTNSNKKKTNIIKQQ